MTCHGSLLNTIEDIKRRKKRVLDTLEILGKKFNSKHISEEVRLRKIICNIHRKPVRLQLGIIDNKQSIR